MNEKLTRAIAELHASPARAVIACTGAGAGVQDALCKIPGASQTILEAVFPYSEKALIDFLGHKPQKSCSPETALRMAVAARHRGMELDIRSGGTGKNIIGLGLTATITTNRPKRGENRVFLAASSDSGLRSASHIFEKNEDGYGKLGREGEGIISDHLALNLLLETAGLEQILAAGEMRIEKHVSLLEKLSKRDSLADLLIHPNETLGTAADLDPKKHILFDGSFNPLHHGHRNFARQAKFATGMDVVYAISTNHPDKGAIPREELLARSEQFRWFAPVLFTENTGRFVDKAERFSGFSFLIGMDTLIRILDQKYYDCPVREITRRLRDDYQAHFYVVQRAVNGKLSNLHETLLEKGITPGFWLMFTPIPGRIDVASRDLRTTSAAF